MQLKAQITLYYRDFLIRYTTIVSNHVTVTFLYSCGQNGNICFKESLVNPFRSCVYILCKWGAPRIDNDLWLAAGLTYWCKQQPDWLPPLKIFTTIKIMHMHSKFCLTVLYSHEIFLKTSITNMLSRCQNKAKNQKKDVSCAILLLFPMKEGNKIPNGHFRLYVSNWKKTYSTNTSQVENLTCDKMSSNAAIAIRTQ